MGKKLEGHHERHNGIAHNPSLAGQFYLLSCSNYSALDPIDNHK